jgi:hypothetical protein
MASNPNDELVLDLSRLAWRRWLGAVVVTLALISALSLAGVNMLHTSVMFNDILPAPSRDRATSVIGHARFVRGDEFLVETPTALGQARSGRHETMPLGSANPVGAHQDADVHAYAPGPLASMLFRPLNLWFLLFSPEAAVIARQWSVVAMSLLAFGLFVRVLMGSLSLWACAALAVSAVFSPPMMWWFTTTHHLGVAFGLLSGVLLVIGSNRKQAISAAVLSGFVAALGAMTTYPPFFLSCAIVSALCIMPKLLRGRDRVLRVVVAGVVAACVAVSVWLANQRSLQAVLDTVYPGNRISSSGEDSLVRALTGPFARFLTDDRPNGMGNQTELASPVYLFPAALFVLMVAIGFQRSFRRSDRRLDRGVVHAGKGFASFPFGALAGGAVLAGWASGLMPTFVGRLIGLGGVPGGRTIMGLLVASIAVGAWVVGTPRMSVSPAGVIKRLLPWVVPIVVVSVGVLLEGLALRRRVGPSFLAWREVIGYSALFVICVLGVVLLRSPTKRAMVAAGLSLVLSAGVNPLSVGLGQSAKTSARLSSALADSLSGGRWAAHEDVRLNAVVMSSGLPTISGVYFFPDRVMWNVLDPSGVSETEWNRYAHVVFRFGVGAKSDAPPVIKAVQSDAIIVDIGICRLELAALGVRNIVSTKALVAPCIGRTTVLQPGSLHVAELKPSAKLAES